MISNILLINKCEPSKALSKFLRSSCHLADVLDLQRTASCSRICPQIKQSLMFHVLCSSKCTSVILPLNRKVANISAFTKHYYSTQSFFLRVHFHLITGRVIRTFRYLLGLILKCRPTVEFRFIPILNKGLCPNVATSLLSAKALNIFIHINYCFDLLFFLLLGDTESSSG